ncbi:MAG: hypothetical protein GF320_18455 [Armatimonadia bacterium]|nr:hypothetical protein [Armatimonadia bacterium]
MTPSDDTLHPRLSRRDFLRSAAGVAALGGLHGASRAQDEAGDEGLPKRKLGPIDYEATIVAIGLGAMGDGRVPEPQVLEVLQAALEAGINYVDCAPIYGETQRFVGPIIEEWRDRIFLVSKCNQKSYDAAWAQVEQTLEDLHTDHLDLLHLHNLGDFNLDHIEAADGTLTAIREMKEQGLVRHIGASGHLRPPHFLKLLEQASDVELIMVPVNVVDRHVYIFDGEVVPAAREAGRAVVAMKVLGGVVGWQYGPGRGRLTTAEQYDLTMRYALGHPAVSTGVVGFSTVQELEQGLSVARNLSPVTEEELSAFDETAKELASQWGFHFGPPE